MREISDISEAEAEIEKLKDETDNALDRIIQTATEAEGVAFSTDAKLRDQRVQMENMNVTLHEAQQTLKVTDYNIKTGFSWGGVIRKKLGRGPKEPERAKAAERLPGAEVPMILAPSSSTMAPARNSNTMSSNAPPAFDAKLDKIDALLDSMALASQSMNAQLKSQNEAMDGLDEKINDVTVKAASQSTSMKRRFRLKA